MHVNRCCSIGLYILLNLNVLCQGQRLHQMLSDGLGFGFPEAEEEDPAKKNAQNKTPVYIANVCKPGEILYPGDQLDDWVCDCRPAYIYYPIMQRCYPAYTKGPCKDGQFLVLPPNRVVPECQHNPCTLDNWVYFRKECVKLETAGPCMFPELPNLVGVNETTLELICTKDYRVMSLIPRVSEDDPEVNKTSYGSNDNGGIGSKWTVTPAIPEPADEHPIVNGTKYLGKRCFVGGIRWTKNSCPQQDFSSNYNYNNNNYQNSQVEINKTIQSIFAIPSSP